MVFDPIYLNRQLVFCVAAHYALWEAWFVILNRGSPNA